MSVFQFLYCHVCKYRCKEPKLLMKHMDTEHKLSLTLPEIQERYWGIVSNPSGSNQPTSHDNAITPDSGKQTEVCNPSATRETHLDVVNNSMTSGFSTSHENTITSESDKQIEVCDLFADSEIREIHSNLVSISSGSNQAISGVPLNRITSELEELTGMCDSSAT